MEGGGGGSGVGCAVSLTRVVAGGPIICVCFDLAFSPPTLNFHFPAVYALTGLTPQFLRVKKLLRWVPKQEDRVIKRPVPDSSWTAIRFCLQTDDYSYSIRCHDNTGLGHRA